MSQWTIIAESLDHLQGFVCMHGDFFGRRVEITQLLCQGGFVVLQILKYVDKNPLEGVDEGKTEITQDNTEMNGSWPMDTVTIYAFLGHTHHSLENPDVHWGRGTVVCKDKNDACQALTFACKAFPELTRQHRIPAILFCVNGVPGSVKAIDQNIPMVKDRGFFWDIGEVRDRATFGLG